MKRFRFAIIFAVVSALLWGIVVLLRSGYETQPYRSVYEKFFIDALFTINIPASFLAASLVWIQEAIAGLPHDFEQVNLFWPLVLASSVQWGLAGHCLDRFFRFRRGASADLP